MALKTSQAMEEYFCGDIWTYLHDTSGRVFRYWVYKRMFTPMEMQEQYIDQSEFTDSYASFGVIRECVQLPDGDLLIGFQDVCIEDHDAFYRSSISYHKISEISLEYHWCDQPESWEVDEEEEE